MPALRKIAKFLVGALLAYVAFCVLLVVGLMIYSLITGNTRLWDAIMSV